MPFTQPEGAAVQVVKKGANDKFELNINELKSILLNSKVSGKKISLISVSGAFRKGKSFLLDFFLRFLTNEKEEEHWMGPPDVPLKGFSWRGGSERETTGIWMWNQPFIKKNSKGEEVAVILMDTQGTWDHDSTIADNVTIFGLSALLSSALIYNIFSNVQEDDLSNLQLFTEYGKLVASGEMDSDKEEKPFQRLIVLVRDWANQKEYTPGSEGGQLYINRILSTPGKKDELKAVREHLCDCFNIFNCFLMPHPGLDMVEKDDFDGSHQIIRDNFKLKLDELVHFTLDSDKLVTKKVNGDEVTCKDLYRYFEQYIHMYQSNQIPEPKSALEATAQANNMLIKEAEIEKYEVEMKKYCSGRYLPPRRLENHNNDLRVQILEEFRKTKKLGNKTMTEKFEGELNEALKQRFEHFRDVNKEKAALASIKTPVTILILLVVAYILSHAWMDMFLNLVYLDLLEDILDGFFYVLLLTLLGYIAIRTSSVESPAMQEVLLQVDNVADTAWEHGVSQATVAVAKRASGMGFAPAQMLVSVAEKSQHAEEEEKKEQ